MRGGEHYRGNKTPLTPDPSPPEYGGERSRIGRTHNSTEAAPTYPCLHPEVLMAAVTDIGHVAQSGLAAFVIPGRGLFRQIRPGFAHASVARRLHPHILPTGARRPQHQQIAGLRQEQAAWPPCEVSSLSASAGRWARCFSRLP